MLWCGAAVISCNGGAAVVVIGYGGGGEVCVQLLKGGL